MESPDQAETQIRAPWLVRFRWPVFSGVFGAFTVYDFVRGAWVRGLIGGAIYCVALPLLVGSRWYRERARRSRERTAARKREKRAHSN